MAGEENLSEKYRKARGRKTILGKGWKKKLKECNALYWKLNDSLMLQKKKGENEVKYEKSRVF